MPRMSRPHSQKISLQSAIRTVRREFAAAGLFSFFINVLMLVSPLFMLQVYDRVLTSRNGFTLLMLALLAVALLAVMAALDALRARLLVRIGRRMDNQTNGVLFDGVLTAALYRPGLMGAQYFRDMDLIRQFMAGPIAAFFDAPWVPVYLGLVFLMHPWLGLVALAGAIAIFALAWMNDRLTRLAQQQATERSVQANELVDRALRNVEALRAMGMGDAMRRLWQGHQSEALHAQCAASERGATIAAVSKAFRLILQVLILGVGAWLAIRQEITPGMMIAASIIMGRGLAPLEQAIGGWRSFSAARAAFGRLEKLFAALPQSDSRMSLPPVKGALSVDRLIAAPPGSKSPVLKGFSFAVSPGEAVAIIGPSAAGKTTLARLILGLWQPQSGFVRLDGAEVCNWPRSELGPQVGYLPQDVELFAGTVAQNIARFGEVDADKVVEAARRAGCHEMILSLPDGYDTQIGNNGANLSAGQRQRLGLARALYGDPRLIVLDEPNANLDGEGEAALAAAVRDIKARGSTLFVISHRADILRLVDKILVLNNGQLAGFGPAADYLPALTGRGRGTGQNKERA